MNALRHGQSRLGLSLVEVLVVIAIIALLTGLTLAAIQAARTAASRLECQSRVRQLALAAHHYHSAQQRFPQGVEFPFARSDLDAFTRQSGLSWLTAILPHVEQEAVWREVWEVHKADHTGTSFEHERVAGHRVLGFRCPSDSRSVGQFPPSAGTDQPPWALTNYLGVAGVDMRTNRGIFHPYFRVTTASITDGTSNTIMIGERPTGPNGYGSSWYSGWGTLRYFKGQLMPVDEEWANAPVDGKVCSERTVFQPGKYDDPCHHHHFWSLHPGGANFAFADG
ncbi:MAG: DUF1559 domain-containing protein, partial [Fimbriiglobus sp.]|nr:DUF1559 domain-containing protein [Fimbriiglobus sp.]